MILYRRFLHTQRAISLLTHQVFTGGRTCSRCTSASILGEMKKRQNAPKLVSAMELKRRWRNDLWLKVLVNIVKDLPESGL